MLDVSHTVALSYHNRPVLPQSQLYSKLMFVKAGVRLTHAGIQGYKPVLPCFI